MRRKEKRKVRLLLLLMLALFCAWIPREQAKAAEVKLVIVNIDYEGETMTIQSKVGDTRLYYSDAKQKTWECAYGTFNSGYYVLDISWISKTKDYTLTLKGDKSEMVTTVVLPKQQTNFKVAYNYKTEAFEFTNAGSQQVYWRKNNSTVWNLIGKDPAAQKSAIEVMRRFYAKGATLYFRLGQVCGETVNGALSAGIRPSKEVKFTMGKQASAPSVSITVSSKTLSASSLLEYRSSAAESAGWTAAAEKKISIDSIAGEAFITDGKAGKDVTLFFRTAATERKLASLEKEITIKAQEAAPVNVTFKFTSPTALSLTITEEKDEEGNVLIPAASSSNPYEYTIVQAGSTLKSTASWTAITSGSAISITSKKAPEGSTIYVRKQAHVLNKAVYYPASLEFSYEVGEYPEESKIVLNGAPTEMVYLTEDVVNMIKTAGSDASGLSFKILVSDVLDPDTDVKTIICGSTALEFKSEKEPNQLIVTITSTEKFEAAVSARDKAYPVKITLTNGEVFNNSVKLTVLRNASVLKSASLEVVHASGNDAVYEFTIVPGETVKKVDTDKYETTTVTSVAIADLEQELTFSTAADEDGNLKVTLNAAALQPFFEREDVKLDQKYPLTITMSDGQKITSGVDLTFTEEAVIDGGPFQFVKRVGSDLTENIVFQMTYKTSGIYAVSATWNGIDIMGNCSTNTKYIYVELDHNKINALTLPDAAPSLSCPVIITLSNGAVVSTGYSLTLQQ